MKTNKLTRAALNWAVHYAIHGECEGYSPFEYSTDWAQGGPIIDNLMKGEFFMMENGEEEGENACHVAYSRTPHDNFHGFGPTLLIAAMRCYVASKLGDDIEIPPELIA